MLDFKGLTEKDFIDIQNNIARQVIKYDTININDVKTVAGVDLAYWKEGEIEKAVCCIVVIDVASLEVIESKHVCGVVEVPYIPGCLAFRELPLVMETVEKIESHVDVYIFDGNGILHPRKAGLATQASLLIGKPTIGVAKTFYFIEGAKYENPDKSVGSRSDIILNEESLGVSLRTHENVKPVFVSIGNKISIDSAVELCLKLTGKESHIPVPTRLADLDTHIWRSKYKDKNS